MEQDQIAALEREVVALRAKLEAASRQADATDRMRHEAERASRAKDKFLAVLSHELRTPLTPVLAAAAALQSDARVPPWMREDISMIGRNVELEARLIDDLLDLTRITKGKLDLQPEVVDVHEAVEGVIGICRSEMFGKQVNVTIEPGATQPFVKADPARLQQIFWNVIKNAIKFTPAGGKVFVRTHDDAGRHELVADVTDTGIGIGPEMIDKIFDAFEQGERSITREFGGLGLGLAISKALVEMQGGKITVASAGKGLGATFSLRFPAVERAEAQGAANGNAGRVAEPRVLRILLVEDHLDTARTMAKLLQSLGHSVRTAATVGEALKMAHEHEIDLLISDIGLPDATGLDLIRQLKTERPLPAIALSGFGMEEDIVKSREAGFNIHLTKPVNFYKLQAVIQRIAAREGGSSRGRD